ncbi:LEAF RUST 10 DISEASE-RESISTANCE LOCUS RECEPTOR-LIKE PROTEIN KINASE-like 1.2 isoform X4 [Vigna angularis]|uniref:LEAF RUST 10 DISEASE-RESISTANCE LOCUS RECEPTOR-LIKE PROTEIN KINASE-like 1.2 isoform X4 n=1 Tax=Phaseolus angularis TaxID=3914 RepID=UPI0022B3027E|nr:LEAF RUST 10 DISEASE-RESISTANCE LOCUS RECEPTOR-LIKE PROTEIN KINASE-like 1.2 isoform X4 [Vigna angularis]
MPKPYYSLFAVFIILVTCHAQTDSNTSAACASSNCGNISIGYPFWKKSDTNVGEFCGYPEFGLECSDDQAIIKFPTDTYQVADINYDVRSITLLDIDVLDQPCPRARHNVSLQNLPLSFSSLDLNLSFYFNCSSYPASVEHIKCMQQHDKNQSYVFLAGDEVKNGYGWVRQCDEHVVVTVKQEEIDGTNLITGFGDAMKKGFVLDWVSAKDCAACEDSDGYCRYNHTTKQSSCLCRDGRTVAKSCKKEGINWKAKITIGVCSGVVGALIVGICVYIFIRRRKNSYVMSYIQSRSLSSDPSSKDTEKGSHSFTQSIIPRVHLFSYEELEEATNYFDPSKELGEGGFGTVYFGKLRDGRSVAVKRLYENNYRRVAQFMNEIRILTGIAHPNLVKLYGCTSRHSRELLLVYEYIPNGTVADHLHGQRSKPGTLPWHIRMNIAVETASALKFLHLRDIIHRDVKTNNILLDSNFRVKVADFGLSRLFPELVTHVSTAPQGTPGYVDPEYHECYQLTNKSDVYSFGVVLVELISSLPAVDITRHRHEINLANMAINKIHNQTLQELVDPNLGFESDFKVRKMISGVAELAFQCLQSSKEMRPSMEEVLETLKDIQSDGKSKSQPEVMDISSTSDDVVLLKDDPPPPSPDSNAISKTTTPNTSG